MLHFYLALAARLSAMLVPAHDLDPLGEAARPPHEARLEKTPELARRPPARAARADEGPRARLDVSVEGDAPAPRPEVIDLYPSFLFDCEADEVVPDPRDGEQPLEDCIEPDAASSSSELAEVPELVLTPPELGTWAPARADAASALASSAQAQRKPFESLDRYRQPSGIKPRPASGMARLGATTLGLSLLVAKKVTHGEPLALTAKDENSWVMKLVLSRNTIGVRGRF